MAAPTSSRMVAKFYLPDTNVLIYALAAKKPYSTWLKNWIENESLVLSSIVVAEFLSGATESEEILFRDILENFKVLPVDSIVAQTAANYKKIFSKKKKKVWLSDCLIAATCQVYGAVLATFDKKDFPMKDIEIITS